MWVTSSGSSGSTGVTHFQPGYGPNATTTEQLRVVKSFISNQSLYLWIWQIGDILLCCHLFFNWLLARYTCMYVGQPYTI